MAAGNLVFKNYQVNYVANSAYTTTSNTKGWEYVGYAAPTTNVSPSSSETQSIKYWDFGATSYTFTTVSALNSEISSGAVTITKNTSSSADGATVYDKGYTIELTAATSLSKLYLADRVNITKSCNTNRDAVNTYGGNVTLKFRNLTAGEQTNR